MTEKEVEATATTMPHTCCNNYKLNTNRQNSKLMECQEEENLLDSANC
jgi:hypothetical protein